MLNFKNMFLKKDIKTAIKESSKKFIPFSYWLLVILRFILALTPQNGYIHPDEFFQTIEPIAGDVLDVDTNRAWEFNSSFPIRSIALSRLAIGIPYKILKQVNSLTNEFLSTSIKTPYFILIFPRIFFCSLSLINDFCLLRICQLYGQNFRPRLITLASSHILLVYATHTFSNSLEIVLLSVLMWLVSDCMLKSDCIIYHNEFLTDKYDKSKNIVERVNLYKLRNTLPAHSLSKCLQIATVTVIGIFNRPTFIAFAFPSVFFWLVRGLGTKFIGFKDFHARIIIFILSALPATFLIILIDSVYYGYLTNAEVHSMEISINNFVVTPFNFLKYNLLNENLATHGIHPRWLHVVVNIPLLFNVLGIVGILYILRMFFRLARGSYGSMPKVQSITGLMIFSFVTPVGVLSIFPHQEPRFLIPIIIPLVFLFAQFMQSTEYDTKWMKKLKSYAFITWCVWNILLSLFFGFIHQGGVYFVAKHFHNELIAKPRATTLHLVTSHIYTIPQSLFHMESTTKIRVNKNTGHKFRLAKQILLYEMGSKSLADVLKQVKAIWEVNEMKSKIRKQDFRLYLVLPSSLKSDLGDAWFKTNATTLALKEEDIFYPHLSTEATPYLPPPDDQSCFYEWQTSSDVSWKLDLTLLQRFKCLLRQFSLVMYKVDVSSYLTIDTAREDLNVE